MTKNTAPISDDPALDPRVRTVLAAAAAPVETTGPLLGEEEALAAFRASPRCTEPTSMLSRLVSAKAAASCAIGAGVLLIGGVGAAAAGVLPGAAQETVSTWLETAGISVPAGEGNDENGDAHGRSEQAPVEEAELPPAADHGKADNDGKTDNGKSDDNGKGDNSGKADNGKANNKGKANNGKANGERVAETAKNSTAEGEDKGEEIAGVASDGRVESGDDRSTQTPPGAQPAGEGDQ